MRIKKKNKKITNDMQKEIVVKVNTNKMIDHYYLTLYTNQKYMHKY